MHLILLLNFNTKLAVYPADEIELIIFSSMSPSHEPMPRGPGKAGLQLWVGKAQLLACFL